MNFFKQLTLLIALLIGGLAFVSFQAPKAFANKGFIVAPNDGEDDEGSDDDGDDSGDDSGDDEGEHSGH